MLFEATLDLLNEGGAAAVTKRSVCGRARLNDRYFYEHFDDRDALLTQLADDTTAAFLDVLVRAAMAPAPGLRHQIRAAVAAGIDFLRIDPRRAALLLNAPTSTVLQQARTASVRAIATVMAEMIRKLLGADAPPTPDAEMAAFAIVAGAIELSGGWFRGELETDLDHLSEIITATLQSSIDLTASLAAQARP
ncbi:TetR/AcrR family transcriptional regulator [Gordonia terrae]|uniref:TetR/AcrR family transcriptional regulator n=1 Tax=Gordonia terrae TaxID=2055 RepID=UPI003F6AEB66